MIKIAELLNLKTPFILASESPRRIRLLQQLGMEFEQKVASIDENIIPVDMNPSEYAQKLALMKAQDIAKDIKYPAIVLGADTIVVLDGKILNKPENTEDAVRMLKSLSGRTHTVFTGIALVETISGRLSAAVQNTLVSFRELDCREIEAYAASGSPLDKAGAYGIQNDFGSVFVNHINGCYYNIVGLPLELLYTTLRDFIDKGLK